MIFFHSHCVFQDLATKKTIGITKEQSGLYYLLHDQDVCVEAIYEREDQSLAEH